MIYLLLIISFFSYGFTCITDIVQYKYGTKELETIRQSNVLKYFHTYEEALKYANDNKIPLGNILKETNIGGYYVALYTYKQDFVCSYISDDN